MRSALTLTSRMSTSRVRAPAARRHTSRVSSVQDKPAGTEEGGAPFGLLASDELRRALLTYPFNGSYTRPRERPQTLLHSEASLREALDSDNPIAVARALSDLFKVEPIPPAYAYMISLLASGATFGSPDAPAVLSAVLSVRGVLKRSFEHAVSPVTLVLRSLPELAAAQDSVVRLELVIHELQGQVNRLSAEAGELDEAKVLAREVFPSVGLAGFDALCKVLKLTPDVSDRTRFVLGLMQRGLLKDIGKLVSRPESDDLLEALASSLMPQLPSRPMSSVEGRKHRRTHGEDGSVEGGAPVALTPSGAVDDDVASRGGRQEGLPASTPAHDTAAGSVSPPVASGTTVPQPPHDTVAPAVAPAPAPPRTILEALFAACIAAKKTDVLRTLVRDRPRAQVDLVRSLYLLLGKATLAGRLAREFRVELAAHPDIRHLMKRTALTGLLRLPARDMVLSLTRRDPEAAAELRAVVEERVALGKTAPEAAAAFYAGVAAFHAALDACQGADYAVARDDDAEEGGCSSGGGGGSRSAAEAAVEEALARVDAAAHALYRTRAEDRGAAAGQKAGEAGNSSNEAGAVHVGEGNTKPAAAPPPFLIPSPVARAALTVFGPTATSSSSVSAFAASIPDRLSWYDRPPLLVHDEQGYLRLPVEKVVKSLSVGESIPSVAVHDVTSLAQLQRVVRTVYNGVSPGGRPAAAVIGIDCEWVSPMVPSDPEGTAILTVSHGDSVWLLDMPALHREACAEALSGGTELVGQRALDDAFYRLFCTPGLAPGKDSGAVDLSSLQCLVLVYGGITDFSKIASSYPYLAAFKHTAALQSLPSGLFNQMHATGILEARPMGAGTYAIAYLDLLNLSLKRQLPCLPGHVAPMEQPRPEQEAEVGAAKVGSEELAEKTVEVDAAVIEEEREGLANEDGGSSAHKPAAPASATGGNPSIGGLSGLCHRLLGKPLNKYFQMSYWERRPLLEGQREYAAIDAWVLPLLLARLAQLPLRSEPPADASNVGSAFKSRRRRAAAQAAAAKR